MLNQINEIDEFIIIELDSGNLIVQTYCQIEIDNQCEVRGEEYGGILIEVLKEMEGKKDNTEALSRISFAVGILFILYSSKKEILKIKKYLWD